MGRATQRKQAELAREEQGWLSRLTKSNSDQAARAAVERERAEQHVYAPYLRWSDHALRTPESWEPPKSTDPQRRLLSLVKHCFHRYQVPTFFNSAWSTLEETEARRHHLNRLSLDPTIGRGPVIERNGVRPLQVNQERWYLAVALGESLYKTCAKDHLTKREVHLLLTCPVPNALPTLEHAVWYAVAFAGGSSLGYSLVIARSKICRQIFDDFWRTVARWFARHDPISPRRLDDLIDYIIHQHARTASFSLNGMTVHSLEKRMTDWHYELQRAEVLGNQSWEGHAVSDFRTTRGTGKRAVEWSISQILDAKRLAEEGTKQRHCVLSYKSACIEGRVSIWSMLRRNPENGLWYHSLTLEVGNGGAIMQVRGVGNREPRADEWSVVQEFARVSGLKLR